MNWRKRKMIKYESNGKIIKERILKTDLIGHCCQCGKKAKKSAKELSLLRSHFIFDSPHFCYNCLLKNNKHKLCWVCGKRFVDCGCPRCYIKYCKICYLKHKRKCDKSYYKEIRAINPNTMRVYNYKSGKLINTPQEYEKAQLKKKKK